MEHDNFWNNGIAVVIEGFVIRNSSLFYKDVILLNVR